MLQPCILDSIDTDSEDSPGFDQPFNLDDRQLYPQCPCCEQDEHYDNILLQESIPGTVDSVFELLFDSDFCKNYLSKVERLGDIQMGDWHHGSRKNLVTNKGCMIVGSKDEQIYCKSPYYMSIISSLQPENQDNLMVKLRTCITRSNNNTKVNVLVTFQLDRDPEHRDQYTKRLLECAGRMTRVLRTNWIQNGYSSSSSNNNSKDGLGGWNDRILEEANLVPLSGPSRLKIRLAGWIGSGGWFPSCDQLACLLSAFLGFGGRMNAKQLVFLCCVAAVVTNAILVHRLVTPTSIEPSFGLQGLGGDHWGLDQLRSEVIVLQEKISRLKVDCEDRLGPKIF
ncbi:hypothetical protein CLU79DRAFT_323971 [Phycomyces nitens]|nr:hypothetical protein CLU79DRAFT_323971 [Phycomyces nitens]